MSGSLPAGRAPLAGAVNRLQSTTYEAVQSGSGSQALTTTETDSASCTLSITVTTAATCIVWGTCDFEVTAASAAVVAVGRLNVAGSTVAGGKEIHLRADSIGRGTVSQCWRFAFSGAGTFTVKLRILKSGAGGTIQANDTHTSIVAQVQEVVS